MNIKLYRRRPHTVEVREVTRENVENMARWAGGEVHGGTLFIAHVAGRAYTNPAFPGDLVVHEGHSFSVWRDRAYFDATFESLT
jgi:hypothetical protein